MKILAVGDVHWSTYSSILRQRGERFSVRLEKLIESVNWAEELAKERSVDTVLYLGDFFDSTEVTAEEISALQNVKWQKDICHLFLTGNHEIARHDATYSTIKLFGLAEDTQVIDSCVSYDCGKSNVTFLPYNAELIDFPLSSKPHIVFSHNDIAGIQMGAWKSTVGYDIDYIMNNCSLFINGHIHNGSWVVPNKVLNLGNLTGQNFSEDAFTFDHNVAIVDTDTLAVELVQNPFAIKFYKLDFTEENDIDTINYITSKIGKNSVLTVRCKPGTGYECIRTRFDPSYQYSNFPKHCGVIASKFIIENDDSVSTDSVTNIQTVDHLKQFSEFILENVGQDEFVLAELEEILR